MRRATPIPTPCRNVCKRARQPHPSPPVPVPVSLQSCLPEPPHGFAFGMDSTMLTDMLSAHCPAALHTDLAAVPGMHQVSQAAWAALPLWDSALPCDVLYIFTDGSFQPDAMRASWAIVVLAQQLDRVCKVGCLSGTCSTPGVEHMGAYAGEVEALLRAKAVAVAADAPLTHIGSDCTSALLAGNGQSGSPPAGCGCYCWTCFFGKQPAEAYYLP